jgi:subtilisin family serine protease
VLSVAAVALDGRPSKFSNRGDERSLTDGIATFGGDATRAAPAALPTIEANDTGIVGVFSSGTIPRPPGPPVENCSGWVRWAGTSFATPIVAGVAAALWGRNASPGLAPAGVMEAVRRLTLGASPPTGATPPLDLELRAPVLRVEQLPP